MLCKHCIHVIINKVKTLLIPISTDFNKSSEKGLMTKECIVTDTYITFAFIHFSTLAIKQCKVVLRCN